MQQVYDTEETVHAETIAFLKNKYTELVDGHEEWTLRYEKDLESKQKELEYFTEERNKNLVKLQALQARWEEEKAMQRAKIAEEKRLLELEELRMQQERKQNEAAKVIQFFYREHLARVMEKRAAEAGAKKKKGAKKTTKKKKA